MNPTHPRLLAAIRGACPETMELTFGCKFKWNDDIRIVIGEHDMIDGVYVSGSKEVWPRGLFSRKEVELYRGCEILGHEIQLSHVLRTLDMRRNDLMSATTQGNGYALVVKIGDSHMVWQLENPLSAQSPATLDWLEKVICET